MFKRANKMTSLLVAAAAVVSLVPASAADVKKIDSVDGKIYKAVAYKDGKFYVDGEINDDEAAYYVADGKNTTLEDVNSGDDAVLFGDKYLDVQDGDYTVDLTDGKVTDSDIKGDTADDAAASLRKKAKDDTDDRYTTGSTDTVKDEGTAAADLKLVPGAKYATPWYYSEFTTAAKSIADKNNLTGLTTTATAFNVYTDTNGNYIDADYNLGKIKVTTTQSGATGTKEVVVENTNDKYENASTTKDAVSVGVTQEKVLTQDANYIYRLVTVTVHSDQNTSTDEILKINGVKLTAAAGTTTTAFKVTTGATSAYSETGYATGADQVVSYQAIQKISKAQHSGDVDGAKYASTVTTYTLSDDKGKKLAGEDLINDANTQFTVVNGKLIAYNNGYSSTNKVDVYAYSLKSSSSYFYCDEENKSSESYEVSDTTAATPAVDVDSEGNLWRLDGGYVYKFDNVDDWDKVYKVDGSVNQLSVYNKDDMAVWSEGDKVYSLIGAKEAAAETTTTTSTAVTTTPVVTPVVTTTGWVQTAAGWTFYDATGKQAKGQWVQNGGVWYMIKADGIMATGWYNDNGTWYFLQSSGAMKANGWVNDGGKWYYLSASGAMLTNTTTPDGYKVDASGAWV